MRVIDGVVEAHGGLLETLLKRAPIAGGAAAMTLGHVVIGRSPCDLDRTRRHERVHVAQYERWGPLFVPAYFFACAVAWWRGHNAYFDSRFEREAYGADGVPVRPIDRRPAGVRWLRRGGALAGSVGFAAAAYFGLRITRGEFGALAAFIGAAAFGICLVVSLILAEAS